MGKISDEYRNILISNRKTYSDVVGYYNCLLDNMKNLSKELNLENSLELSIFFSYLLWSGYLSKTKVNFFDKENRKNINGLFFADIMDGRGVCLNHSEMLKDFLNYCGYKCASVTNYHNSKSIKVVNSLDIERKFITESYDRDKKIKNKPNHVFNLIEDFGKLYVYDSTNFILEEVTSPYSANVINGSGKTKMFPYDSFDFCITEDEVYVMDKLFMTDDSSSSYSKKDFVYFSSLCMDIIRKNSTLFEDFYAEVKPNILRISEETDKIKIKEKIR